LNSAVKVSIILLILLTLAACKPAGFIYTRDGKIECGGDGEAIILKNNPAATDPTFAELVAFIKADPTDTNAYIKNGPNAYVCSDFAEEVHNNAEAAGIRAAWVGIRFNSTDEGHAVDAFETVDKGLVYIDCTNSRVQGHDEETESWDAVAYVETGRKYGILHIDRVIAAPYEFYALQYDFYADCEKGWQDYKNRLDSYNKEVQRYNKEISGRVYIIGSPEEQSVSAWKEDLIQQEQTLDRLEKEVGSHWYESEFSSYTVEDVQIHW
jgi:hypothetical protein